MVRGKIEMKKIEKGTSRQVTFSKRRSGLVKKARELSVLCDAQVALIIFSEKGRIYDFSSCSSHITEILERYHKYTKDVPSKKYGEDYIQQLKFDSANMAKKIELLELDKRKLLGQSLNCCSYDEFQRIEDQLQRSLKRIRLRRDQLYKEHIEQLQSKEINLLKENAKLKAMCLNKQSQQQWAKHTEEAEADTEPHSSPSNQQGLDDVETELFIGLPKPRFL